MSATSSIAEPSRAAVPHFVLKPRRGWQLINLRELIAYRDLFYFLVWRDIKVRYAQSVLGVGWAIIQPVFQTAIFMLIFRVGGLESPAGWPPMLFWFSASVAWTFFSASLLEASGSLVSNANMISKVYFPRLVIPIASVIGKLVDFAIALTLLGVVMAINRHAPTQYVLMVPVLVILMCMSAAGIGMLLTALAIQYRDVRYAMNFSVSLLMWLTPVAYSSYQMFPQVEHRLIYAINPMVGVIEGFRFALLGVPGSLGPTSMPWDLIGMSALVSSVMLVLGALYFRRMERVFSDVA